MYDIWHKICSFPCVSHNGCHSVLELLDRLITCILKYRAFDLEPGYGHKENDMRKIGLTLGVISLLSLMCTVGSFAEDRTIPWQLMKGSMFIGADVENTQGQNLGDVKDIVIDRGSGRIAYAVVSFGGFLGLGEKLFAVPWGAFSQKADKDTFVLAVDKERLQNAPGFDASNWPQMASREWVTGLYTYYNIPPYWTTSAGTPMTTATIKNVDPNQRTITLQV
jgi:sporulation protein YlmC with PRC-barrel domain